MEIKRLNTMTDLNIALKYSTLYQNKYDSYADLSPYGWNMDGKYTEYADNIIKNISNICHISEYIDHDGCDSDGFNSNQYSLYIITKNNDIYTYYLYEFERWFTENEKCEYILYNKKDSKLLNKTKQFFYKTL